MTERELDAGDAAVRKYVDDLGYGSYVSEEQCRAIAASVLLAAEALRKEG